MISNISLIYPLSFLKILSTVSFTENVSEKTVTMTERFICDNFSLVRHG